LDKVPPAHQFLDLSDYARPAARWLVRLLLPTPITSLHVTWAFTLAGLGAALLLAAGRLYWLAALLLLVKSGLDAADGALARARGRPSRVGRFLDSLCDFAVNVAVYAGIAAGAYARTGQPLVFLLALIALVCGLLQVSLFNHYYVRYRAQSAGDRTSQVAEREPAGYPWDNPRLVAALHRAYLAIYGWQDALVAWLDQRLAGRAQPPLRPSFMTAVSVLGLGTQLAVLAACALLGRPVWALWAVVAIFNLYALVLLAYRRLVRR
jgi:phosphatidylglycerophosphate synthase